MGDDCWMDDDDYSIVQQRSLKLIGIMDNPEQISLSSDTNTMVVKNRLVCVRGLERMTTQRVEERSQIRMKLFNAVIRAQQDGYGEEAIRQVSRKYSKPSTKVARMVGISDEVNAASSH